MNRIAGISITPLLLLSVLLPAGAAPAKKTGSANGHAPKAAAAAVAPVEKPVAASATHIEDDSPAKGPQTWALLVGISKYQNQNINSLRYPAIDATSVRDALVDPTLGGVPADHVKLLTNEDATRENIVGSVDDFFKPHVQPGDKIIVFLAGHGVTKGVGANARGFLLSNDVRGLTMQGLEDSAVDLRKLSNALSELPASQFVVFVDACREDPTPGRGLKGNLQTNVLTNGASVIPSGTASSVSFFACSVGQRAYEDPNYQHGVFTYWILDGIKQGAVPQRPDGAVDMGRLTSYVSEKVREWSQKASASGDDEIDQTPEAVSWNLSKPVVLMHVKRTLPDAPVDATTPLLVIDASPDSATISLDGTALGTGSVQTKITAAGDHAVHVAADGYVAVDKTIHVEAGYEQHVSIELQAAAANVPENFDKAQAAEAKQQWEVAAALYQEVINNSPQFAPAYERLAHLQQLQGMPDDALTTLVQWVAQAPTAHSCSLLANAYAQWTLHNDPIKKPKKVQVDAFGKPQNIFEAALMSSKAANAAVLLGPDSPEASAALGFSIVAMHQASMGQGNNDKKTALAAFGKAVALKGDNPEYQYAYGFGIRYFAQELTGDAQKDEVTRAIDPLKAALDMRPDYYDAHRELAYCYHMLGRGDDAIHEYDLANANRGDATDKDEVAGNEVALSALHKQQADNETGDKKQENEDASSGYLDDAKETSGDDTLKVALRGLQMVGLGGSISSFLPASMQQALAVFKNPQGAIQDKVRSKMPSFGLPF